VRELLANLAVIAATAATLFFLVPQIVKLVRTGDAAGVSTTWPAIGLASNVGWTVYYVHGTLWAPLVAPIGATTGYAVTLWALARMGRPLGASAVRGAVAGAVLVATTAVLGWTALGVALGLSFGVTMVPTLWTAYRTWNPSGISPGTWWLGLAEAVLWGFYGWHHADAGILTFSVIALGGSAAMLARYAATHRRIGEFGSRRSG
jgi:uncharacterized protein with PQ loop repeat